MTNDDHVTLVPMEQLLRNDEEVVTRPGLAAPRRKMIARVRRRCVAVGGFRPNTSAGRVASPSLCFFAIALLLVLGCPRRSPPPLLVVGAAWTGTFAIRSKTAIPGARQSRATRPMGSSSSPLPATASPSLPSQNAHVPTTKKRIAIIGGGIAGLSCAQRLTQHNSSLLDVTVFDTGRVRPGGRASSRQPNDPPKQERESHHPILSKFRYDHAAQVVHVDFQRFPEFSRQVVEKWVPAGMLRPFPAGSLLRIASGRPQRQDAQFSVPVPSTASTPGGNEVVPAYYYAPRGMGSLVTEGMVAASGGRYELRQDVWISPSNGARYKASPINNEECGAEAPSSSSSPGRWTLQAKGRTQGQFDEIVIAHNGKCADRLMSSTPARQLHRLLRVNFDSAAPRASKKMVLNSLYSWTFCLPRENSVLSKALGASSANNNNGQASFMCGFVENCDDLRFVTCQSNKLDQDNASRETETYEVWTVLSSPQFAKAHKAPQESLGPDVIANVTRLLGASLESFLELPPGSVTKSIVDQRLQLWGAGLPLNTLRTRDDGGCGFVYDAEYGVGVCGDWLLDPSVAGAWTSGHRLADHLLSSVGLEYARPPTRGLEETGPAFERVAAAHRAGIGSLEASSPSTSTPPSSRSKPSSSASSSATSRSSRSSSSPSGRRPRQRATSQ